MLEIFHKGGPIMWPLLITSVTSLAVVLERLVFLISVRRRENRAELESILDLCQKGEFSDAAQKAQSSGDYAAKVLGYGITHRKLSIADSLSRAAGIELDRFSAGLSVLDTIITLAPLLGLLGTVTGMISAFGLLGGSELDSPTAITGGIAEALIATAFGLGIAIVTLIPFNLLQNQLERAKRRIEDAGTQLEMIVNVENDEIRKAV